MQYIGLQKESKITLEQAIKPQRMSEGITLLIFLTLALDGVGGQCYAPPTLPLRKRPNIHCTDHLIHRMGGWVGRRVSLDRCAKSCLTSIRFLDHPTCSEFKCNATWKLTGLHCCSYASFLLGLCTVQWLTFMFWRNIWPPCSW
jgi:hypothetical protein